jgi:hypothetical protein
MLAFTGSLGLAALAAAVPSGGVLLGKPAAKNYKKTVLASHPVAYWGLGGTKGKIAHDASGHKHHGKFHGSVVLGQKGAIRHDKDKAIKLHRKAYVEIPSNKAFSQPTSRKGLTVEVWVRPDVLVFPGQTKDPYVHWLGKGTAGQFEWGLRFYSKKSSRPNRISAYVWNPKGKEGAGAFFQDKIKVGEWIHVVATFDPGDKNTKGAGVSIYKNGKFRQGPKTDKATLYSDKKFHVVPKAGKAPVRLGTRDLGSFLVGDLDEVAIYPRVLTAAEIRDHYRTGIA